MNTIACFCYAVTYPMAGAFDPNIDGSSQSLWLSLLRILAPVSVAFLGYIGVKRKMSLTKCNDKKKSKKRRKKIKKSKT